MNLINSTTSWAMGTEPEILEKIHDEEKNIAIWERDISSMEHEISDLLDRNIELRTRGDSVSIMRDVVETIGPSYGNLIVDDITQLLQVCEELSGAGNLKLLLARVNSNMCRRFHTDVNSIRMLCTYSGPGTLWLSEDKLDRDALSLNGENDQIVLDEDKIGQARTGSVVLLKGAIYPKEGTRAIVHRSPTIEESGKNRLLLRIDTNDFLSFLS